MVIKNRASICPINESSIIPNDIFNFLIMFQIIISSYYIAT